MIACSGASALRRQEETSMLDIERRTPSRLTLLAATAATVMAAVLAHPLRAQIADERYTDAIEMARAAVGQLVRESGAPAVQAAVAVDGVIVWSEAFGFADVELRALATTQTKFRIASISKAITGTLAAKLAAEGRLDLDAPVQTYVKAFPEKQAPITCRQLAGHTSGVRHYRGGESSTARAYPSCGAALVIFAGDDLEHDPGEKMTYSTYGYTLLGAAIEGATGEAFGPLLRREILAPLGMQSTVVEETYALIPGRAAPYEFVAPGRLRRATFTDHSYKIPGGGMLSTAEDLVRLGSALLAPGALDDRSLELALTSHTLNDGRATGYAMGWRLARSGPGGGVASFGHGGSQAGSRTYLHVDADSGVAVALLCNAMRTPVNRGEAVLIADLFAGSASTGAGGVPALQMADEPAAAPAAAAVAGAVAAGESGDGPDVDVAGRYELASVEHPDRTASVEIWRAADGRLRGSARIEGRPIGFDAVGAPANEVTMLGFAGSGLVRIRFSVDGETIAGALTAGESSAFTGRRVGE
jgi:serine beta-lactamase-like protein LACTB